MPGRRVRKDVLMRLIYVVFILMSLFLTAAPVYFSSPAQANSPEPAQFLTSIPDVPLMPGLVELSEQTVTFDKPSGRIIESALQIHGVSEEQIRQYYESVLPQFGWSQIEENAFVRGAERLQMGFENYEDEHFLRITVIPQ